MKINNKILSIPPYISTTWSHIDGIYMKGATLVITLFGGESVNIPGLKPDIIDAIFAAHAESLELEATVPAVSRDLSQAFPFSLGPSIISHAFPLSGSGENAFQFGISSMDGFGTALQHNPLQANAPDIPLEILQKISAIVKIVVPEDVFAGATPFQNCNCPHCQITRAICATSFDDALEESVEIHEPNGDAESTPSNSRWKIEQTGENLYAVTDFQDSTFNKVFLGQPIGCTCGESKCIHIEAVLRS